MLPPEVTEELHYLELSASRRIRSQRFGQAPSRLRGTGYDFDSHRKYEIGGSPPRRLERVGAHAGTFFKRHFEEKEVVIFLAVDVSRSMRFLDRQVVQADANHSGGRDARLSAAADNCHLGFIAFSDKVEAYEAPRKGQAHARGASSTGSTTCATPGSTNAEVAIRFLRSLPRRMSIVFLLSDFILDEHARQLTDLPDFKALARKHDVVPIVFEDELERSLPKGHGLLRLRASEGRGEVLLSLSSGQRARFEAMVEHRKAELRDFFFSLGMECMFLPVAEPFMDPLMALFERRKKG